MRIQGFKVWLVVAGVILAGAGFFYLQNRGVSLDEQLAHLPSDDGIFLVADGAVIRQVAGAAGGEEQDYKDFVDRTGFDFRRDLDRLVAVIGEPHAYYLASGRFNWAKISAYAGNCVKGVCSLPASQPGKWISLMQLREGLIAIAVSTNQLEVGKMEATRKPLLVATDTPFLMRGRGRHFARFGLSGDMLVEARLTPDALVLSAGGITHNIPLAKLLQ